MLLLCTVCYRVLLGRCSIYGWLGVLGWPGERLWLPAMAVGVGPADGVWFRVFLCSDVGGVLFFLRVILVYVALQVRS